MIQPVAGSRSLDIALVSYSDYPWRSGGVNQLLHNLMSALVTRGHTVTVYVLDNFTHQERPVFSPEEAGIEVVPLSVPLMAVRSVPVFGPLAVIWSLRTWPRRAVRKMETRARHGNAHDVVIADFTNASAALASTRLQGAPIVVLRWANWAREVAQASRTTRRFTSYLHRIEEEVLSAAPCVVVNGRDIERDISARGVPASRQEFIPSAVDTEKFSAVRDTAPLRAKHRLREQIVLFPSMLRDIKGFDHLLQAFALLPDPIRNRTSVVATGRGDDETYRALASRLGVSDNIVFLGEVGDSELPAWFAVADIAVFPYLFGAGTSVASIEAMAAGLPLVAYRVQSFEDVIDDQRSGILVEIGDIEGLAGALEFLLANDDARARMSQASREAAKAYDVRVVAEELESVLVGLVEGGSTCDS